MTNVVAAIDIGYSGNKGKKGHIVDETLCNEHEFHIPSGAGPKHLLIGVGDGNQDGIPVRINEEDWLAGIAPARFEGVERTLSPDYVGSHQWMANLYAAFIMLDEPIINILSMGLPTEQSFDEEIVKGLVSIVEGEHHVNGRKFIVEKVIVLPQPSGAFSYHLNHQPDDIAEIIQYGTTVVVDPGQYSNDWCVYTESKIRRNASGHNSSASSWMIDHIADVIGSEVGIRPNPNNIEMAIKTNREFIVVNGKKITLLPYIQNADKRFSETAYQTMKNKFRHDNIIPDVVIISGGGCELFSEGLSKIFSETTNVLKSEEPVLDIVRGLFEEAVEEAISSVES